LISREEDVLRSKLELHVIHVELHHRRGTKPSGFLLSVAQLYTIKAASCMPVRAIYLLLRCCLPQWHAGTVCCLSRKCSNTANTALICLKWKDNLLMGLKCQEVRMNDVVIVLGI